MGAMLGLVSLLTAAELNRSSSRNLNSVGYVLALRPDIAELPHFTSTRALTKRQRRRLRGRQL